MVDILKVKKNLSKDLPIYISNKIIESHFALPLGEQRLLYAYISKLSDEHVEFPELEISAKEYSDMVGLADPNYKEIKNHIVKLMDRKLEIETEEEWVTFHWFTVCRYKKKEGKLRLRIHDELKPYMLRLKKEFTKLITQQVMQFRSSYSTRIYMLCKQYQTIGKRIITVEELKKKLGLESEYKKYNDFKKRVLEQAHKEINAISDIEIHFEEVKQARKVVELLFHINKNIKTEITTIGIEKFKIKSMAELATMLCKELKKRWGVELQLTTIQKYKKSTIVELLCAITRGAYDGKVIPAPLPYFKAALENIELGESLY